MKIHFHNEDVSFYILKEALLSEWIISIIDEYNFIPGELNFIFCSDEYLLNLNQKFLDHNYYTDIISFNDNVDNKVNGDIFISIERVKENSNNYSSSFNEELKRVIIHGVLHLLGFSDESEDLKMKMRKMEDTALEKVKDLIIT